MVTYTPSIGGYFERMSMAAEGGAYIIGLFLGLVLLPEARKGNDRGLEKIMRYIGWAGIIIFLAVTVPVLYTQEVKHNWMV